MKIRYEDRTRIKEPGVRRYAAYLYEDDGRRHWSRVHDIIVEEATHRGRRGAIHRTWNAFARDKDGNPHGYVGGKTRNEAVEGLVKAATEPHTGYDITKDMTEAQRTRLGDNITALLEERLAGVAA